jgi:hypothetical protein
MPRKPKPFTPKETREFEATLRGDSSLYAAALRLGRPIHLVAYRFALFVIDLHANK